LEAPDAIAFDLLELGERTDGLGNGFAETVLSEACVLAGNEQVGCEAEIITHKTSGAGAKAQREERSQLFLMPTASVTPTERAVVRSRVANMRAPPCRESA